jgi:hypothetical protein
VGSIEGFGDAVRLSHPERGQDQRARSKRQDPAAPGHARRPHRSGVSPAQAQSRPALGGRRRQSSAADGRAEGARRHRHAVSRRLRRGCV